MTKIFNPKHLKDPIAMKTEWTPILNETSGNFRIKKLSKEENGKIRFNPQKSSSSLYKTTILLGTAVLVYVFIMGNRLIPLEIIAVMSILIGTWGLYLQSLPISFDKSARVFKKGRNVTVEFDHIYAVQTLSKEVTTKAKQKGELLKYKTYELNLILNDGSRVNVIAHGGLDEIRQDSASISKFIDKPLWDAIS